MIGLFRIFQEVLLLVLLCLLLFLFLARLRSFLFLSCLFVLLFVLQGRKIHNKGTPNPQPLTKIN